MSVKSKHPIGPDGVLAFSHFDCCSQGGGVRIQSGDVTFTNTNIYENTAGSVRPCLLNLPIDPMGCSLFHMVVAFHREVVSALMVAM